MDHALLCAQLRSLADEDAHYIPLLSNASALLNDALENGGRDNITILLLKISGSDGVFSRIGRLFGLK